MRGKGGFIKILEAFIAILIIAGVMTFIFVNQLQESNQEETIHRLERIILEEISKTDSLRNSVLNDDVDTIKNSIEKFIPAEYDYNLKICELNVICVLDQRIEKEVFSDEITISSTLEIYSPKVVRIFMWEKN